MVQAVVSDSGPVDLDFRKPDNAGLVKVMSQFLSGPSETLAERIRKASPISHVSKSCPPLLLIYGTSDNQVTIAPVGGFVTALHQAGVADVTYIRLGLVDHYPYSLRRIETLCPIVDEFFARTLNPQVTDESLRQMGNPFTLGTKRSTGWGRKRK